MQKVGWAKYWHDLKRGGSRDDRSSKKDHDYKDREAKDVRKTAKHSNRGRKAK